VKTKNTDRKKACIKAGIQVLPLKGFRKSKRFTRRVNLIFSSEQALDGMRE